MKNFSKEKRNRLLLVLLGTVASIAGLYYGVIATQRKSIEAIGLRYIEQENKLTGAERLAGNISQFQKNLETTTERLKTIEGSMASGDMYSWVILTINTFKENHRVDIPQFSREIPMEVGMFPNFPYRAAAFHLRGTAHFHDFGRFVADFENSFPYMRIQNIELEPPPASNTTGPTDQEKLSFKMEVVALVNPNQ